MFTQIYLKELKPPVPTYQQLKFLDGTPAFRIKGKTMPAEVFLEEQSTFIHDNIRYQRSIVHNYIVPLGYKWFETQHWIWTSTERTFKERR